MVQEYSPNTIWLGGMCITPVHTYSAGEAITPGQLVILVSDGGTPKWYKANSATNIQPVWVALEQDEQNLGIDDNYAAGDLVKVAALGPGCTATSRKPPPSPPPPTSPGISRSPTPVPSSP
jgi:hypothetical protein